MPTVDDFQKLRDAVATEFVTDYNNSGVNGLLCTATDGSNKTLFFPTCGNAYDGGIYGVGSDGYCWSSSLMGSVYAAYGLHFDERRIFFTGFSGRLYGFTVRGVLDEK